MSNKDCCKQLITRVHKHVVELKKNLQQKFPMNPMNFYAKSSRDITAEICGLKPSTVKRVVAGERKREREEEGCECDECDDAATPPVKRPRTGPTPWYVTHPQLLADTKALISIMQRQKPPGPVLAVDVYDILQDSQYEGHVINDRRGWSVVRSLRCVLGHGCEWGEDACMLHLVMAMHIHAHTHTHTYTHTQGRELPRQLRTFRKGLTKNNCCFSDKYEAVHPNEDDDNQLEY